MNVPDAILALGIVSSGALLYFAAIIVMVCVIENCEAIARSQ